MRNLLIYLNPSKQFSQDSWGPESEILIKIQIDNSLALGWKPKDIMLVTNFDYEYRGVKAIVIDDQYFCELKPTATKVLAILHLMDAGLIDRGLFWYHDLDAFQLEWITEEELDLGTNVFALTDYGKTTINEFRDRRWSTGTIFFTKDAEFIFKLIKDKIYQYQANEEVALLALTRRNRSNMNAVIKKLNITYNLATRKRDVSKTYEMADKPLKVIHFHPFDKRKVELGQDNIGVCVYGKNRMGKVLVNQRIKDLFTRYKVI